MLNGKVAVVTGASRGIGRAVAIRLAKEGAIVIINYNGSKERAEAVKSEIETAGGRAEIWQCNVSDYSACEEMFKEITAKFGSVDILVNNAGITKDGLLMKMSGADCYHRLEGKCGESVRSPERGRRKESASAERKRAVSFSYAERSRGRAWESA